MSFYKVSDIKIAGITACVPGLIFKNSDYNWISEKERNELIRISGVKEKRHSLPGIATSDLSQQAAEKLIDGLNWDKSEIDLLVFASQSRDYILPATACILQDKLGLSKNCMAFDIDLGCSAYIYSLSVVCSLLSGGHIKKALLLVGDVSTQACSSRDKTSWHLFGDAATATALEFQKGAADMYFNLQTDGSGEHAIIIPESGFRNLPSRKSFNYRKYGEGIERHRGQISLDGSAVYKFALKEVVPNVTELLKFSETDKEKIDYFIFHQSNKVINEAIRLKMKLPSEKVPSSLEKFGNTSSASVPLTIVSDLNQIISVKPLNLLLSGFGAGFSWGSALVHTDGIYCPEIFDLSESTDLTINA